MIRSLMPLLLVTAAVVRAAAAADEPLSGAAAARPDTLATAHGPLVVHPFGHATLALEWDGKVIMVDPVGDVRRFAHLPRPDLILVTHGHGDHFDADAVRHLAGEFTWVVTPPDVAESVPSIDPLALANGDSATVHGIGIMAVPACNRTEDRLEFHPRGRDNGYLLDLAGIRVYVSGDTEDLPEFAVIGPVDVAFLCMNLPYTMSGEQALAAARALRPAVLYPYHYRNRDGSFTDVDALQRRLRAEGVCEVRLLNWY